MGLRNWIYKKTGIKLKKGLDRKKNLEKLNFDTEAAKIEQQPQIIEETINNNISKLALVHPEVYFDDKCTIDDYSYVVSGKVRNTTHIGKYCSIAHNITIGADRHPINWLSTHPFQYKIGFDPFDTTNIGNDVWIGANVVIMTGLNIGDGAIIGANSTVTKDIPPYAIVVGSPAKIIRYRFTEDIIKKLLDLAWWDIEHHLLIENNIDFNDIEKAIEQVKEIKKNLVKVV